MLIKKNSLYFIIKMRTPSDIDFYEEHQKIIKSCGFVWFCKFGKTNVLINKIKSMGNHIFIIDSINNNNRTYLAEYSDICYPNHDENVECPKYYGSINKPKCLWIRVISLKEIDHEVIENNFSIASTHSNVKNGLRSMCQSFYIVSDNDIEI